MEEVFVVEAHFPLKIRAGLGKSLWPLPFSHP